MPSPPNRMNVIRVVRGQTKVLLITVKDQSGRPAKLNQATDIRMSVRHEAEPVVITKKLGEGIDIVDASKGQARITLSSEDTNIAPMTYQYDVWVSYEGTPPVRDPVVKRADMIVTESVTSFV